MPTGTVVMPTANWAKMRKPMPIKPKPVRCIANTASGFAPKTWRLSASILYTKKYTNFRQLPEAMTTYEQVAEAILALMPTSADL